MSNPFDDIMALDAQLGFLGGGGGDFFVEDVVYTPAGGAGTPRTIRAQVLRQQIKPVGGFPHGQSTQTQLVVATADVPELERGDTFTFAAKVGGAAEAHKFVRRVSEDVGMLTLEVK